MTPNAICWPTEVCFRVRALRRCLEEAMKDIEVLEKRIDELQKEIDAYKKEVKDVEA